MEHKILCAIGGFAEEAREILKSVGPTDIRGLSQEELPGAVADCTCLIVQLGLVIDRSIIDAASGLRCIATPTTGTDHIDADYARSRGITVLSLKGETEFLKTITATAELALGLMIALMRKIPAAHGAVLRGEWKREPFRGHSLAGKTIGIVGYGRLGTMMARFGGVLGMTVVFADPGERGSIPLGELLQQSDVVSLHVPLNKETEEMIGAPELALMKPTAVLINTSRGKIVDEDAIIAALEAGKLAGYATDVLADELSFRPEEAKNKLIDYAKAHDNVIVTPHIGGMTAEARAATDIFIARKVREALR